VYLVRKLQVYSGFGADLTLGICGAVLSIPVAVPVLALRALAPMVLALCAPLC
jgi:hypothetical protein